MSVQERVLEALEQNRGKFFSGGALARELAVSRSAVWKAIDRLRDLGYPIDASTNRGYRLLPDSAILSPQSVARYLTVPGLSLEVYPSLSSTNTVLRQRAEEGAPEGTVVLAGQQTAGRGRRDHGFFSPADSGLYVSILLRPAFSAADSLCITTCAAVSAAQTIEDLAKVPADIKWVNDLFCRGKKVCGILTEAALDLEGGGLRYAIVGIGLNLFPPKEGLPPELSQIVGSVFPAPPELPDCRSRAAAGILNRFFTDYPRLLDKPFFEEYRRRSFVLGQEITILSGGEARSALALDLDRDFQLVVREADGTLSSLSSGEVSIRPKN